MLTTAMLVKHAPVAVPTAVMVSPVAVVKIPSVLHAQATTMYATTIRAKCSLPSTLLADSVSVMMVTPSTKPHITAASQTVKSVATLKVHATYVKTHIWETAVTPWDVRTEISMKTSFVTAGMDTMVVKMDSVTRFHVFQDVNSALM